MSKNYKFFIKNNRAKKLMVIQSTINFLDQSQSELMTVPYSHTTEVTNKLLVNNDVTKNDIINLLRTCQDLISKLDEHPNPDTESLDYARVYISDSIVELQKVSS